MVNKKATTSKQTSVAKRVVGFCAIAIVAVITPVICEIVHDYIDNLDGMNGTSTSTWYYVISTLGIYHSYSPIVDTNLGSIKGLISASREGREFYEFRGIPYAKAPINELRFEPPVPFGKWEGLLTADKVGPACLQFDAMVRGVIWGKEDCLKLNVFTPHLKPEKLMPVLAYIHGGGFTGGESTIFYPKYIMDHDMVVVTFNYRLASLGFLNTGDEIIRGNMGLKDQNMALRWIQANIHSFGGDPKQVTLMGESAGGASTHYHVISPLSRGLFQRAIVQSGTLGSPWALTKNATNQALKFGKTLGCPTDNTTIMVDCLRRMDPRDIVKPHVKIMSPIHTQDDFFPGSIEAVQREDTFLSENPLVMLERGDFAHIPVIFGVTNGEGGLKTARLEAYSDVLDDLGEKWNEYVPILMHYDPNRTDVSDALKQYYFSKKEGNGLKMMDPADDLINVTKMLSAGLFFEGVHRVAKYHAKYAPTYLYYYTYISESLPSGYAMIRAGKPKRWWHPWEANVAQGLFNYYTDKFIWRSKDPKKFGACHGDDVPQVFSMNSVMDVKTISSDYPFSKELVRCVAQFASNDTGLHFGNVHWPMIDSEDEKPKYMAMNIKSTVVDEPFYDEVKLIESLNIRDPLDPNNW